MNDTTRLEQLLSENRELRIRLEEAEETIRAIREGAVDAVIVQGPEGDRVFTLSGEDVIYRRLVETMNEVGMATTQDGQILFCNERFSQMLKRPMEQIVGQSLEQFTEAESVPLLQGLLRRVSFEACKQRLVFVSSGGDPVPVLAGANLLNAADTTCVCMVAMDLTELEAKNRELQKRADQLQRLASELTLTEKRERHRLAKVLHDHLQQLLVGTSFGLEALRQQAGGELRNSIDEINACLKESIEVSRSLTVELSPTILHEGGLAAGLEWLAKWMQDKHGLEVDLHADADTAVDRDDVRIHLFESVRELLFNIVKHAGVKKAAVRVRGRGDQVEIAVSDDGAGFRPEEICDAAGVCNGGFGLFSIRERLELLGGSFVIDSKPLKGTTCVLAAPVRAQPHAEASHRTIIGISAQCPSRQSRGAHLNRS